MRIHTGVLALLALPVALAAPATAQNGSALRTALVALENHIQGSQRLTASQIDQHKRTIDANRGLFASDPGIVAAAQSLVSTYDRVLGPLWIARGQFDRRTVTNDIHWTTYHVMQYVMDEVYTPAGLAKYETLLNGYRFGCAAHFPGAVNPPPAGASHTVTIEGSYPDTYGRPVMHETRPARKPTGTYLAPGSIATVTVPPSLVGRGFQVRVGAHSWDTSNRPWVRRLDRCTTLFPITATTIKVANPLGGGIYIEVPLRANAGRVQVTVRNAVRSPFFSARPFHRTTLAEWRNRERNHPAPWADFQSEKYMMQVPTSWIYRFSDPVTLMKNWDAAMDATNDLMGYPHIRGREALYNQVDVIFRAAVYAPGYPSVNVTYNPKSSYSGNHGHHLLRGPQFAASYEFHEMGHGYLFQKFPGETESNVNLLHVAVWHRKFGKPLDVAFRSSSGFGSNAHRTLSNTAVAWMMCQNFRHRRAMAAGEKAYQLKGHAKFVDVARLLGWGVLGKYWKSFNDDHENGVRPKTDIDSLLFRMSKAAGVDVTPLFHFWGIPPTNHGTLRQRLLAANLRPSAAVLATLQRYQSLVPADRTAFRSFARNWWTRIPSSTGYWTERDHAALWNTYDASYAATIRANVGFILGRYYEQFQARTTRVGTGCIARGPVPNLVASTFVFGSRGMIAMTDCPPGAPGLFLFGIPHAGLGVGHGCRLYVDPAAPVVPLFATANGSGLLLSPLFQVGTSVPAGTTLGVQGGATHSATQPFGLALSNGLVLRIGY